MKEKGFLFLWIAGCILFYTFLENRFLAFVLPRFPLRACLLSLFGLSGLFLFSEKSPRFLRSPLFIFPLPLLFSVGFFLVKFPPAHFSSIVFQDDFTSLYAASLRTLGLLKEGTLFGWDSRLLGGYYTVSDLNFNLGIFALPFYALFGPKAGYHLFILSGYLLFPLLVSLLAGAYGGEREEKALAFWLSSFFAVTFFRNILLWGNIDNLLGLDLFLLVWLLLERGPKNRRTFFWLTLLLASLAYAHLAYFAYALLLVFAFAWTPSYRGKYRVWILVGAVLFLLLLPYAIHFFRHPDFFLLDAKRYQPSPVSVQGPSPSASSLAPSPFSQKSLKWFLYGYEGVHGGNYGASALLFSPFLLFLFWKRKSLRPLIAALFLILLTLPLKAGFALSLKRSYFLLPVLLSLLLPYGVRLFPRSSVSFLILVPALLLGTVGLPSKRAIAHQVALSSFSPALYEKLSSLDGHTLFLETQALWIETDRGERPEPFPGPHVHKEMLLALETGKRYLSHGKDGYPFSIYRETCLMSGIWKGEFLDSYDGEEVNAFLKKWGVRYIIVFSERSKRFFSAHPSLYEALWEEFPWLLFRLRDADPRSVVVPTGEGEIVSERYTRLTLRLSGVRKGEEAVLRMNYHPDFKGLSDGRKIPLRSRDGQLAFTIPQDGDLTVRLDYPRYTLFTLAGLGALLLLAGFLWRGR